MTPDFYRPAPGLVLAVSGHRAARAHFTAEYGPSRVPAPADVRPDLHLFVDFVARLPSDGARDGHKTVRWAVSVGPASQRPLELRVLLAGRPRSIALSLVQGFVVEPVVSLAAADAEQVLLPAAAVAGAEGVVILLGRSRSGKTSVVARTVAAGGQAWGDDQVLVDGEAAVRPWPRRLRVYPDLRSTAPAAVAALPRAKRSRLRALAAAAALTRGYFAPSTPLSWGELGGAVAAGPVRASRLVVVERGGRLPDLAAAEVSPQTVVDLAVEVLREQRARLRTVLPGAWSPALARAEAAETAVLSRAVHDLPAELWTVPGSWQAPQAVAAVADRLGLPS